MKKALKIIGITLASSTVMVFIALTVALCLFFSSRQRTEWVKQYVSEWVNCEVQLAEVDLTLFKTFPNVGVEIKNVVLTNPMTDSISDTMARIHKMMAVVDTKKLLKEKELIVRKCTLEDAFFDFYTNSLGQNNFDVFNFDIDTILSNYLVDIEDLKLINTALRYTDARNAMTAEAHGLNLDLNGEMQDTIVDAVFDLNIAALSLRMKDIDLAIHDLILSFDGDLKQKEILDCIFEAHTPDISLTFKENRLEHNTLNLNSNLNLDFANKKACFDDWEMGLNQYEITARGQAKINENEDVNLNVNLFTNSIAIENILAYLPENIQQKLKGLEVLGKFRIKDSAIVGTLNDSLMPRIEAEILADNMTVKVPELPYPLSEVNLLAHLDLDLNNHDGEIEVESLKAKFNRSKLAVNGLIDDVFETIQLKLNIIGDMPMSDLKAFVPESIRLEGLTHLALSTQGTLEQLKQSLVDHNLSRLNAMANLTINDFAFDMDTIHATAPRVDMRVISPAATKAETQKGTYIALASEQFTTQVGKAFHADLKHPDIQLFADNINGGIDGMFVDAALKFSQLDVAYDTITAHIDAPTIALTTSPTQDASSLNAHISLESKDINANVGEVYAINTNQLKISTSVKQDKTKTDFFDRWNPSVDFTLDNAVMKADGLAEDLLLSDIDMSFSPHQLDVKESTLRLGQSDMSLQGYITGITDWLKDHKNQWSGNMQVTSDLLDLNEILDLASGLVRSDEERESQPIMVPEGIDFNCNITTNKALLANFDLSQLNGTMTIKDGTLVFNESCLTDKAAEMQLSAMYQSPQEDNLFMALDLNLLNVQINDLLYMIPYVDTLLPVLKNLDGLTDFHLGGESYLTSNYEPKISTMHAVADIEGKDLTLSDQFNYAKMNELLKSGIQGRYRIDSIDVQPTAFENEIGYWPSQSSIEKSRISLNGHTALDQDCVYHLTMTQSPLPLRLVLKISSPLHKLHYDMEEGGTSNELKKKISDRLGENVQ